MLKTKKLNAVIALEIILSMILYYFVLIGYTAITYAIDLVETNNHNVDFTAYFMDENGEKTDIAEKDIKNEQYLYIDVSVKNEGYFNGTIKIENSNFRIENKIISSNISEILDNEIHLNQINAGTTETIKVAIKAIQQETIQYSKFTTKTDIVLNGKYVNSKNVEKEQFVEINGKTQVEIKWISSSDAQIELSVDTLTNSIFKVNEEDKRILQLLINSKLNNNDYPIKNTLISLNAPNGTENTQVFARSTDSTNAQIAFDANNYIYDDVKNKLTINLANEDIENISWKKDTIDSFVVTYIINKDQDIKNFISNIDAKLTLYDDRELTLNKSVNINENIDKIVSNDIKTKENSIYKGKIYTGEEREYNTTSNININFKEPVEKIAFKEDISKFVSGENEINANIIYKNTSINKQNFLNIFGEDGFIIVKNSTGTIIANVNNNTEADENGNIVVNYVGGEKSLIFETSKPISEGVLRVNNTKAILNSGLTREEINSLSGIKETTLNMYNDNNNIVQGQNIIELKNTTTKANFNVNVENLTSMGKNENVKMEVVLENTNESLDLFQNPTIKITFPKQVKEISAKCKLMYGNGLEIGTATINKAGENNAIEISLVGTQASYNTEVVNGTTILIYADITLDRLIENSNEEIKLNYTNELASNYSYNGEIKKNIKIEGLDKETIQRLKQEENEKAKARALAENNQISDGIKSTLKAYVGGQEINQGDTVYTGEVVKYELTLENVGEEDIENINISANVPEGCKCVKFIKNLYGSEANGVIKASEDEYKELDIDKIEKVIEKLSKGQENKVVLTYEVKIDENSTIVNLNNSISILYNGKNQNILLNNKVEKSDVSMELHMITRSSETIITNDEYVYILYVKNNSSSDISNINININVNSSYKLLDVINYTEDYKQMKFNGNEFKIENLPSNNIIQYILSVKSVGDNDLATISCTANNKYRSNEIIEEMFKNSIKASLTSDNSEKNIYNGDKIVYKLKLINDGNMDLNNIQIQQKISKYLQVESVKVEDTEIEYDTSLIHDDEEDIIEEMEDETDEEIYEEIDETSKEQNSGLSNENINLTYSIPATLKPQKEVTVTITTMFDDTSIDENKTISSWAEIYATSDIVKTEEIKHYLKLPYENSTGGISEDAVDYENSINNDNDTNDNNENNDSNSNNNNDNQNNNDNNSNEDNSSKENENINNKYSISGSIWLDKNEDGSKDNNEFRLDDIKIILYNLKDNSTKETTTNNGKYIFNKLENGKYILIFEYNKEKYILTKYKTNRVSDSNNSDVENVTLNLNGKEQKVSATDTLEINNANLSNIDLGLIEAKKFDLSLTKTISKVTISNQEGNTIKEYDNTSMAKVEIAAKYLSGSTIVIEYNISVKNEGELAGYVKQIVDYLPKDLTFNSSLNKDWYQSGEYIYTNSLADKKIEAGETKELKLIVTKKMTESNTGLVNNTAELTSVANSQNIEDIDSTPGNKQTKEDDLGSANIIISVKTGAVISYITITLLITGLIFLGAYEITKKVIKNN
ncbi:MAG: hypothetical protein J5507_03970 [Clostridia bacterium]|nr:hypothetical protein [Clostridia bacterium]